LIQGCFPPRLCYAQAIVDAEMGGEMMTTATWRQMLRDESGVSSVEYAILGAMIIAVCALVISMLGLQTRELFGRVLEFWK